MTLPNRGPYMRSTLPPQARRVYRDYAPASSIYLADRFAPTSDAHTAHVEAVREALNGNGFPFYPDAVLGVL